MGVSSPPPLWCYAPQCDFVELEYIAWAVTHNRIIHCGLLVARLSDQHFVESLNEAEHQRRDE